MPLAFHALSSASPLRLLGQVIDQGKDGGREVDLRFYDVGQVKVSGGGKSHADVYPYPYPFLFLYPYPCLYHGHDHLSGDHPLYAYLYLSRDHGHGPYPYLYPGHDPSRAGHPTASRHALNHVQTSRISTKILPPHPSVEKSSSRAILSLASFMLFVGQVGG
jgi:hypothetical protein